MFGIQPLHLIIVGVVALIIFGPKRLPELGRGLGRAIREFRKGSQEMANGFHEEVSKPIEDGSPAAPPEQLKPVAGKHCTQCNASSSSEALFCSKCGTKLPT
jgi:sec-independent protein translocase protein TatA